jgi:hypothetical protein
MGRGGFPPSETGSFSAHHTAQWVGFLHQVSGLRCQVSGLRLPTILDSMDDREESREEWEKELIDVQHGVTFAD